MQLLKIYPHVYLTSNPTQGPTFFSENHNEPQQTLRWFPMLKVLARIVVGSAWFPQCMDFSFQVFTVGQRQKVSKVRLENRRFCRFVASFQWEFCLNEKNHSSIFAVGYRDLLFLAEIFLPCRVSRAEGTPNMKPAKKHLGPRKMKVFAFSLQFS